MQFDCHACGRGISVPDQYAGKRVRCPGCQTALRVPMLDAPNPGGEMSLASQPLADLSGLEDNDASGVRRMRQILIGCGACKKTIKIAEARLGKTAPCSACGTLLKVDAFNLSKAKGDLIDMTHLELEKADLLLDGGPHGSTIGGSSIQLDGTAGGSMGGTGGYELNMPPSGSMSGVVSNTSQTQMRELRELNDLKHSGQITNEEYRERKKEIYAGKSLAIQAMSRSADGSGNRPVLKADDSSPLLPKPVVLLIVLAVLGGAGYAGWSVMQGPSTSSPDVAVGPAAPQPAEDTTPEQVAVTEDAEEEAADDADESATPDELADGNEATGDELAAGQTDEQPLDPELAVTMLEVDHGMSDSGIGSLLEDAPDEPVVEMTITDWPTDWPVYTAPPDDRRPIVLANQLLLRMAVRDNRATLGVAVGPPAEDFDSPAYLTFRQEMQGMVTQWAEREGILENLNLRTNDRTTQLGSLEVHRLHVTAKGNRNGRATILTGIQDGYCVTYWFDGHESLYRRFPPTVGLAVFEPLR